MNHDIGIAVNQQQKLTALAIENNGRILELQSILDTKWKPEACGSDIIKIMAKVTAPLFSISASGEVAGTIRFAKVRAGNIAFSPNKFRRVSNPTQGNQFSWRAFHGRVLKIYKNLSAGERAILESDGIYKNYSAYHSFMHYYLIKKPSDLGNFTLGESTVGRSDIF